MRKITIGSVGMLLVLLAAVTWTESSIRAQSPAPGAPKVPEIAEVKVEPASPLSADADFQEQLIQLREDMQSQGAWLIAKQSQLRASEMVADLDRSLEANSERLGKKGILSPLRQRIATISTLDSDADRAMDRAEILDLQIRQNRTKRQLARLEKEGPPPLATSGDRSLEITEILTRLRMAEQAIDALQADLRQAREKIRVLERHIRLEDVME